MAWTVFSRRAGVGGQLDKGELGRIPGKGVHRGPQPGGYGHAVHGSLGIDYRKSQGGPKIHHDTGPMAFVPGGHGVGHQVRPYFVGVHHADG